MSDAVGSSSEYRGDSSDNIHPTLSGIRKQEKRDDYVTETYSTKDDVSNEVQEVQRGLKSRHISMIAIGGTIGTGLFISTGMTLANAGPVSAFISYLFMTTLAFSVTQSLGEMATLIPVTGSFAQFVGRWCSPAFGAANGWCYWFAWSITYALELSVVGQVIQKWTTVVPLAAWIGIFFVILTAANLIPVKFYGEIEFWIASMKFIAVVGWILYAFIMVCGAGKTGPVGFRYWRDPGPWGPGLYVKNVNTARFLGWLSSLISAAFTFQGCELVGIAAGESRNPHKTVPSAIRKVLFRILVFYVLCMFFIGLLVPYNDPQLENDGHFSASSPFIIAMQNSGTKVLPDIFNAVILITIISAGNSNVYCGSRILYGLAEAGIAPRILKRTNKHGVPYVAVLFTALFGLLGFMATSKQGNKAFSWLLNITATAGLIAWGFISFTHIRFMKVLKSRGISRDSLPFKAMLMPYSAYYAATAIFILTFIQGYSCFFELSASSFLTAYISIILFVACYIFFYFFFNGWNRTPVFVPIDECDIDTGVRTVEEEEWDEAEDQKPMNAWEKFWDWVS